MDGGINSTPDIDNIPYHEGYFHRIKDVDVSYVTYNPLSWINFWIKGPKIAGMHSACYWSPIHWKNGLFVNLAAIINVFTSRYELAKFEAVHQISDIYPVNHPRVIKIPNFVDSTHFRPTRPKNEEFTVGFCSRKVFAKGYDVWLEIKKQLKDEMTFIETGNIPDGGMPDFYSKCHAIIVPARLEVFGLTLVEAQLCGTEVLSSGILPHKAVGLPLYYAENISQYVDILRELKETTKTSNPRLRRVALKYSKKNVMDRLEQMFVEVAGDE